ncbi:MAG: aminotransferase class III-fold pyridoxal phosphate-dependent enzyme, partial [Gammaproteobacteria bacterium]|nr:aminotransferase class III-fold pyridoxal phosphate-dependent enzyme [Gammaproteobacteria bacterium]
MKEEINNMYPSSESKSAQLFERAKKVMPGGNTRSTLYYPPYPIFIVEGRGSKAIDADGVARVDFINCFSASIHGHCHPEIIAAAQTQLTKLISVAAPSDIELELAEILVDRIPAFDMVRFCSSGTEAVMHTIRAARAFTGKARIARIEGSYHGTYDAAEVSQNSGPANWGDISAPASTSTSAGTPEGVLSDVAVIPMNDIQTSIAILENHKEHLAAVLLDPLPSMMSYLPMRPEFIAAIRVWCDENHVVLIFDEVLCLRGGYRGMQGEYNITPDLTATGKLVGGGFPIGVFGG